MQWWGERDPCPQDSETEEAEPWGAKQASAQTPGLGDLPFLTFPGGQTHVAVFSPPAAQHQALPVPTPDTVRRMAHHQQGCTAS